MKDLLILMVLIGVVSCAIQQTQELDPKVYYERDLNFEYKDIKFTGAGVLPYEKKYKIKVIGYGKLDVFVYRNCSSKVTSERPDKGIFAKNGRATIEYEPNEIEIKRHCPLYVETYNEKGKHASGVIYFEKPKFKLKSKIICNGDKKNFNGVAVCQNSQNLLVKISFDEPVKAYEPTNGNSNRDNRTPCRPLQKEKIKVDGKYVLSDSSFEFNISNRECNYIISGKNSKEKMSLTTIGYENFIVRGI